MSKANYDSYVKAYLKKQESLRKKGLQMYDSMYSKSQFEYMYEATRNDLKREVAKGKRKVIGNVTQTMVSEQAYEYTQKQGTALKKYAEATGQKLSVSQIRAGLLDWGQLKEYQAELKSQGFSGKEINEMVGQAYFGS